MHGNKLPDHVRRFIFEAIDSVEQLEVLILLRAHANHAVDVAFLSRELRSSASSIERRLASLVSLELARACVSEPITYIYRETTTDRERTVDDLLEQYKLRPQAVVELIFSPMKKARLFANAFILSKNTRNDEDSNG